MTGPAVRSSLPLIRRVGKFIGPYVPNRSSGRWAMTVESAPGVVYPLRTLVQLVGGRTWSVSIIRQDAPVKATEFWGRGDEQA